MRKNYVVMLATILISASTFAQKGNNQIGLGGDLSIPTGDAASNVKTGIGLYVKGLFGVGQSGQVTVTSGYTGFKSTVPEEFLGAKATGSVIPLLLGYRHNFNGFFVEPQLGYAVFGAKVSDGVDYYTDSQGGFTWAAGIGYVVNKKVELSARYQNTSIEGLGYGMFGLRFGYNFSLGGSK